MSSDEKEQPKHPAGFATAHVDVDAELRTQLARLDGLVDWERRDRASGAGRLMRVDVAPASDLLARAANRVSAAEAAMEGDGFEAGVGRMRVVHVAGTKGKGSVCSLIDAGLRRAGYRVGLFASPHVERINERVRINGVEVGDRALAAALEVALDAREAAVDEATAGAGATWFDIITIAAVVAFERSGAEWAVMECGLGGRLDSTNALRSDLCVITNIGLEHTAILGSTRAEIAAEKAGIVKSSVPVVTGLRLATEPSSEAEGGARVVDPAARVVAARCREMRARLVGADASGGEIERRNAALAGTVLDELGREGVGLRRAVGSRPAGSALGAFLLDPATRAAARLKGREELIDLEGVPVVLDGAHVAESLEAVLAGSERPSGAPVVVFGIGKDKDAGAMLKVLEGAVDRLLCTSVGPGPYVDPGTLTAQASALGIPAECWESCEGAFRSALERAASQGGWVLVTGSLHLVGALRRNLAL